MIIPSKHNGYVNGVRRCNGGGGGGGASASVADSGSTGTNPGFTITGGGTTGTTSGTTTTTPAVAPWGTTQQSKADYYNSQLAKGQNDAQIRASVEGNTQFGGPQSNVDWNTLIQTAGMSNGTGRPLSGSGQFYQPVYQQQYQNYNTGNPMGISQYGQQPSGGFPQMQTPFSMFGGQMMGGGYGQFGENNPYNPFTNSFLNMPSNLSQGTMQNTAMEQQRRYAQPGQDYRTVNQQQMQQQNPTDRMSLLGGTSQALRNPSDVPAQGFGNVGGNFADLLGARLMGDQYKSGQSTGFASGEQQGLLNMLNGLRGQAPEQAQQQNQPIFSRSSMRRMGPIRAYEEGGIASLLDTE